MYESVLVDECGSDSFLLYDISLYKNHEQFIGLSYYDEYLSCCAHAHRGTHIEEIL